MPLYSGDIDLLLTDFGVNAEHYSRENGVFTPIRVLFYRDSKVLDNSMGIEVSRPAATYRTSKIPDVQYEDTLTIDGDDYTITSIEHKNNGLTTLILSREITA